MKKAAVILAAVGLVLVATWIITQRQNARELHRPSNSVQPSSRLDGNIPAPNDKLSDVPNGVPGSYLSTEGLGEESSLSRQGLLHDRDSRSSHEAEQRQDRTFSENEEDKSTVARVFVSLNTYFEAGLTGDVETAATVCVPGSFIANQAGELRQLVSDSEELPFDIYADDRTALAVSSEVGLTDKPRQPTVYLVITLQKGEAGDWLISDIDGEDFDGAVDEIDRFLEKSNNGRLITDAGN